MLDGGEGEHPAGVEGKHTQGQAHVRSLAHSRLQMSWHVLWVVLQDVYTLYDWRYILGIWHIKKLTTIHNTTLARVTSARVDLIELKILV